MYLTNVVIKIDCNVNDKNLSIKSYQDYFIQKSKQKKQKKTVNKIKYNKITGPKRF